MYIVGDSDDKKGNTQFELYSVQVYMNECEFIYIYNMCVLCIMYLYAYEWEATDRTSV